MKRIALVLCAVWALWAGAEAGAQQGGNASARPATGGVVGTAGPADESALTLGDAAAPKTAVESTAGTSTLAYFIRMVVVLALVLAAIYGVYRLMKRAAKPKVADSSVVRVLASSSLGPGKALHVVSVGAKAYLIGATDSAVNLVAELEDRDLVDALVLEAESAPKPGTKAGDFAGMLARLLGAGRRGGAGRAVGPDPSRPRVGGDFLAGQRERLRKF